MLNAAAKTALGFVCTILLLSIYTQAQDTDARIPRLFDAFGDEPYGSSSALMDNVAGALADDPSVTAYIIVYRGRDDPPGKSHRYARRLKNYLDRQAEYRGFASTRVVAVDGGIRETVRQEVWMVPIGASPPKTSPIVSEEILGGKPVLFDEYPMQSEKDEDFDSWDGRYEDALSRLNSFATALKSSPESRGYIVARALGVYTPRPIGSRMSSGKRLYAHVRSRKLSDPLGADVSMASGEKRFLVKSLGIEPSRLVAIGCGYGKHPKSEPEELSRDQAYGRMYVPRSVELWIIPKAASCKPDRIQNCKVIKGA